MVPPNSKTNCIGLCKLLPSIQHYSWGGKEYIPTLLGLKNEEKQPYAELWIGSHPAAPSKVISDGKSAFLTELLKERAVEMLGPECVRAFGPDLPYLLKVLDAERMLSIQVHPSRQQAEKGYLRENKAGIAPDAKNRNYKDKNHKPEIHVALTEFWMLHGFRPLDEIDTMLNSTAEFKSLRKIWGSGDLQKLYKIIMTMPQTETDSLLQPLIQRLAPLYRDGQLDKDSPDFWAARAADFFPLPGNHLDRGIFSIYLFNLLHLQPGEGTFQAAGVPHAYLQGTNVELMANSDNVLRGGLTPKHIDVDELLRVIKIDAKPAQILKGENISSTERLYTAPVRDFKLCKISLKKSDRYLFQDQHGLECMVVIKGNIKAKAADNELLLKKGDVFMAPANMHYTLTANSESVIFKASTACTSLRSR